MIACPLCRLTLGDDESMCPRDGREGVVVPPVEVPEAIHARFEIVQPYGRGRSGDLYLADDRQSGRRGVLKLIRMTESATPAERARLKRELLKQATLGHTVLSVPLATGDAGDQPWIFRDWHEGVSLAVHLARGGALAVPEALTIAAQIAAALDELHRAGLLHRDLKPGHVLVEPQPSGLPRVHVIDAGVAARVDTGSVFEVVGTPEYLSPEQAKGKLVSFRSDLYALGCVLYEMLVGEPPFTGSTEELLGAHGATVAPTPQTSMPSGVSTLLAQLLAKEPRERPFSAQQVRRALEPFLPEDASSKREATQAFEKMSDKKRRRIPGPRPSGTLRPPSAKASVPPPPKARAGVPPPPSKSADATDELSSVDLEQAEHIVAAGAARPTAQTLMGGYSVPSPGAAKPSRDPTEELSTVDLEQAEEVLARAPRVASASLGSLGADAVSGTAATEHAFAAVSAGDVAAAGVAGADSPAAADLAAGPAAAPPWQAKQVRVTEPPRGANADDLDYDDLAETVMYDKDKEDEPPPASAAAPAQDQPQGLLAQGQPQSQARTPAPVATSRPAKKKGAAGWAIAVLGLLAGGCVVTTVGVGGAIWMFTGREVSTGPVAVSEPHNAWPTPPAYPRTEAESPAEPIAQPRPEPVVAEPTPAAEPPSAAEPAVAEPAPEPAPEPPTSRDRAQPTREPRAEAPREPRPSREPAATGGANRFESVREEALAHFRARRFPQAAASYQEATRLNPRHAGSFAGLGASFMSMGQHANAVRAYQRAVSLSPRHAGFYAALGQAYHASGDSGRARQSYTRALALDPSNRAARSGLERL